MRRQRLFPTNKWYTLGLIVFLAGSAVFLRGYMSGVARDWGSAFYRPPDLVAMSMGMDLGPPPRGKKYREEDGRAYLWASGNWGSRTVHSDDARWWDMTDALVDPKRFDHGVGVDSIPSIDAPVFAMRGDPEFAKARLPDYARVIGVEVDGEFRAYPISIMDRHELINDTFGETHLTVAW